VGKIGRGIHAVGFVTKRTRLPFVEFEITAPTGQSSTFRIGTGTLPVLQIGDVGGIAGVKHLRVIKLGRGQIFADLFGVRSAPVAGVQIEPAIGVDHAKTEAITHRAGAETQQMPYAVVAGDGAAGSRVRKVIENRSVRIGRDIRRGAVVGQRNSAGS